MRNRLIILAMRVVMLACNLYMGGFAAVVIVNSAAGRPHVTTEALIAVGVCVVARVLIGVVAGLSIQMWKFTLAWTIVGVSARPFAGLLTRTFESDYFLMASLLIIVGVGLTIYGATDIGSTQDSSEVADI